MIERERVENRRYMQEELIASASKRMGFFVKHGGEMAMHGVSLLEWTHPAGEEALLHPVETMKSPCHFQALQTLHGDSSNVA
jgi:hypothetical protein